MNYPKKFRLLMTIVFLIMSPLGGAPANIWSQEAMYPAENFEAEPMAMEAETAESYLEPMEEAVSPDMPATDEAAEAEAPAKKAEDAGMIDSKESKEMVLLRGELATLKVYSLTRLSISDPNIADVASADADKLLIIGKALGQTVFFIWDEYGKRTIVIRVQEEDQALIKARVEKLLKSAKIEGLTFEENAYEGKLVIAGDLSKEKYSVYSTVVGPFGDRIISLVKEELSEDLIQIDMQVAELNTTLQKSMGIDWTAGSAQGLTLSYKEAIPTPAKQLEKFIKVGDFTRTSALLITINNLLQEGKGRVLSKPKLVVVSGKQASFQVGGQIPVRTVTTSSSGISTENVSFVDYGIMMSITPKIRRGKIDITLSVVISDIDSSVVTANSVAFTRRSAQTQLLLDDQQTIVLAGLIKSNRSEQVKKIPFLGDIPIIGLAFRSRTMPSAATDTEIVITLTPTILSQQENAGDKTAAKAEPAKTEETVSTALDSASGSSDVAVKDKKEGPADQAAEALKEEMVSVQDSKLDVLEKTESKMQEAMPAETETMQDQPMARIDEPQIRIETPAADNSPSVSRYVFSVQKKISEAISYPYEAVENGWEGTVKLTLKILKDGSLEEVTVKESSGHNIFDTDAVNTAEILAPYAAFPPELELNEITVTIPIVYSQDSASLDVVCRPRPNTETEARPFLSSGKTYEEVVQEKIAGAITYPESIRHFGWEGTVRLNLRISRDGTLSYAEVRESSGHKVFDQCALQTAKAVAPFSVFPADSAIEELNVTVPIVYSLEK